MIGIETPKRQTDDKQEGKRDWEHPERHLPYQPCGYNILVPSSVGEPLNGHKYESSTIQSKDPVASLLLVVMPFLVAMPGATNVASLFLVAMPFVTSSVLVPSGDALCHW